MTDPSLTLGLADLAPRARIREAALRLYAEHGEQATSIRRVADEANMSPGAVMHHFKSKEELTSSSLDLTVMGRTMLQLDDPDHHVYRAMVSPAFPALRPGYKSHLRLGRNS